MHIGSSFAQNIFFESDTTNDLSLGVTVQKKICFKDSNQQKIACMHVFAWARWLLQVGAPAGLGAFYIQDIPKCIIVKQCVYIYIYIYREREGVQLGEF